MASIYKFLKDYQVGKGFYDWVMPKVRIKNSKWYRKAGLETT